MNYEERVVVFIDILGFKNIINDTVDKDDNDIPEKIKEIHDLVILIRKYLGLDKPEEQFASSKRITQFSDSIVISFLGKERSAVFYTLSDIQGLIINLALKGITCRGGVSSGKLIHTDKIIFGPALNQAYETESKAALFPRVILDKKIIEIGQQNHAIHHDSNEEKKSILSIVKKDTDEMYYVDYFEGAQSELDNPDYDMPRYMGQLRKIITNGSRFKNVDLKVKYGWMKNKYNYMVSLYKNPEFLKSLINNGENELSDFYKSLKEIK